MITFKPMPVVQPLTFDLEVLNTEGRVAYKNGDELRTCPYPYGTLSYWEWRAGWLQSQYKLGPTWK